MGRIQNLTINSTTAIAVDVKGITLITCPLAAFYVAYDKEQCEGTIPNSRIEFPVTQSQPVQLDVGEGSLIWIMCIGVPTAVVNVWTKLGSSGGY